MVTDNGRSPIGVVLGSMLPPGELASTAKLAEDLGYGEIWIPEDYFFLGGIAASAVALGATREIPVGLGIASAVVRNPAVFAQDCATLCGAFPGRFWPGVGLGAPDWLRQMDLYPKKQLAAVRECVETTRRLLAGEKVSLEGDVFQLRDVVLTHPPVDAPPIYCGVMGPKMVALSGDISDGLMIGVTAPPQYVEWAKGVMAEAENPAGRTHRFPTAVIFSVDKDAKKAREAVRATIAFYLAAVGPTSYSGALGINDELKSILASAGSTLDEMTAAVMAAMPEEWVDSLAVAGDPDECAEKIRRFMDAGATSLALTPFPAEDREAMLRLASAEVLPRFGG